MLPVAILTTSTFDATTVAPATLRLGVTGTEAAPVRAGRADVDDDGDVDIQLLFAVQETGLECGDTTLILKGRTTDGQEIEGSESIETEGCPFEDSLRELLPEREHQQRGGQRRNGHGEANPDELA